MKPLWASIPLISALLMSPAASGQPDVPPPAPGDIPPPAPAQPQRSIISGLPQPSGPASITQIETKFNVGPPLLRAAEPEKEEIVDQARGLINEQLDQFGIEATGPKALQAAGRWVVHFNLSYQGLPLTVPSGASLHATADGRAISSRIRNVPIEVDATEPTVTAERAIATAVEDFRNRTQSRQAEGTLAQPEANLSRSVDQGEEDEPGPVIWVDPQRLGHLAWDLVVHNADPQNPVTARYKVSAVQPGLILEVKNPIPDATAGPAPGVSACSIDPVPIAIVGRVTGAVWVAAPSSGTDHRPLSSLFVRHGDKEASTGDDGGFTIESSSAPEPIRARLAGPNFQVETHVGDVLEVSAPVDAGNPISVTFEAPGETETAQVTAYYWAQRTREVAGPQLEGLLPGLRIFVNRVTPFQNISFGNAYFNPNDVTINFFRSAQLSPTDIRQNTATSDIVAHEYGHAIDFAFGGRTDAGLSEGIGDMLAVLTTRQFLVGRGIRSDRPAFRDMTARIPYSRFDAPHRQGHVLGGFVWHLIENLRQQTPSGEPPLSEDEAFNYVRDIGLLMVVDNPPSIPEAVRVLVELDDDDFDLSNGTRNTQAILDAAQGRFSLAQLGLASPSLAGVGDTLEMVHGDGTGEVAALGSELPDRSPGQSYSSGQPTQMITRTGAAPGLGRVLMPDGASGQRRMMMPMRERAEVIALEPARDALPVAGATATRPSGLRQYVQSERVTLPEPTALSVSTGSSEP